MISNLYIINNEKCANKEGKIFCQNLEIKLLGEDLMKFYDTNLILRDSKVNSIHEIKKAKILLSSNIFSFLKNVFFASLKKNSKYLIISITPYTFLSFIVLFLFRKEIFLYLRSSGEKEVKLILGKRFLFIYKIMEYFMVKYCEIICVNKEIVKNSEYKLVSPSSIDNSWLKNISTPNLEIEKLLYVGRFKVEKGIYFLTEIFSELKNIKNRAELTLVGHGNELSNLTKAINIMSAVSEKNELIKIYDDHNIIFLPSYTEGHPRVLIESLARKRPIIVFEEIKHVKKNYKGVFVSKRDVKNLSITVDNIMKNYKNIQREMDENKLPTKDEFILQLKNIIKS